MGLFDRIRANMNGALTASEDDPLPIILRNINNIGRLNIFDFIPARWEIDEHFLIRMRYLIKQLSPMSRKILNSVLWDRDRLRRFCIGPSSIKGHHNTKSGNLKHTIETAETTLELSNKHPFINKDIALLCGLLHDIGKADEYIESRNGRFKLSCRGKLLGHRITIVQWLTEANIKYDLNIPDPVMMVIIHNLTATPHLPDWAGYKCPATIESNLVSHADRISGQIHLFSECSLASSWGKYHPHIKCAPYRLIGGAR